MACACVPTASSFEGLVTTLLGRRVKARSSAALATTQIKAFATYVHSTGALAFVTAMDVSFVASVGAALALIPVGAVNDAIKSGRPSDLLIENAHEVLNIAASLYNEAEGCEHVKLDKVTLTSPDAATATRLTKATRRIDLTVEVAGYPDGKISFFAVSGV